MPQNEFTIGNPGGSMRNNKFFIIGMIIFALIFLSFDISKNQIIVKLNEDVLYKFYFLEAFLFF